MASEKTEHRRAQRLRARQRLFAAAQRPDGPPPETRDQRLVNDALRSRGPFIECRRGRVPRKPEWEVSP